MSRFKAMLSNRRWRVALLLSAIAVCALALSNGATAQPAPPAAPPAGPKPAAPNAQPAPNQPRPQLGPDRRPAPMGKPAGQKPAAQPGGKGLPQWHPPVGGQQAPKPSPEQRRKQLEMLRELARKRQQQAGGTAAPAPKRPKYPVDEHGYCVGNGPNDVPKPINLVHGWLGYKDEYAAEDETWGPVRPPRLEPRTEDMSFTDNLSRQMPYWKWRLTPYPYRYDNHGDHCDPKNQPIPLLANIINIGVLFFLIRRFGKKPLLEGLKARKKSIMSEIDRARAIRKNASERLDKYQHELENLDDKLSSLREQYAAEGEHEEKRMVQEMGETRDRMMADAEFRISQESKSARDNLSRDALEGALTAAEALLLESIKPDDHKRLAEEYLDQIGPALQAQLDNLGDGGKDA